METDATAAAAAAAEDGGERAGAAAFDVESYIGAYAGDTKLKRLEFIAKKVRAWLLLPRAPSCRELRLSVGPQAAEVGNTEAELQACRQLHNLAKQGTNTTMYRAVCAQVTHSLVFARALAPLCRLRPVLSLRLTVDVTVQIGDRLGAEHQLDAAWIAKTDKVRTASRLVSAASLPSYRGVPGAIARSDVEGTV